VQEAPRAKSPGAPGAQTQQVPDTGQSWPVCSSPFQPHAHGLHRQKMPPGRMPCAAQPLFPSSGAGPMSRRHHAFTAPLCRVKAQARSSWGQVMPMGRQRAHTRDGSVLASGRGARCRDLTPSVVELTASAAVRGPVAAVARTGAVVRRRLHSRSSRVARPTMPTAVWSGLQLPAGKEAASTQHRLVW
jgi:hypothetical protein